MKQGDKVYLMATFDSFDGSSHSVLNYKGTCINVPNSEIFKFEDIPLKDNPRAFSPPEGTVVIPFIDKIDSVTVKYK